MVCGGGMSFLFMSNKVVTYNILCSLGVGGSDTFPLMNVEVGVISKKAVGYLLSIPTLRNFLYAIIEEMEASDIYVTTLRILGGRYMK